MVQRVMLNTGGAYFSRPTTELSFIHSGCHKLDCDLGGGWPLGRISNIVGDKSTGKTLLAIEACANFAKQFPKGKIFYRETESAFEKGYAQALGMPIERIDFGSPDTPYDTVEDMFEDVQRLIKGKFKGPSLYIVDSLDALSDRAEMGRALDDGSFNLAKQKMLSRLFRSLIRGIEDANMHVMIISQLRAKIGVMFGEKYARMGGMSLDFYASQVVWLSQRERIVKTDPKTKIKWPVGVRVASHVKKNKVGMPFRQSEFEIRFRYGIMDLEASADWLVEIGRTEELFKTVGIQRLDKETPAKFAARQMDAYLELTDGMSAREFGIETSRVNAIVDAVWQDIERSFAPVRAKYG